MRKILLSALISLLLMALLFHLLLGGTENPADLWTLLRDVSRPAMLVYLGCQLAQTAFRAARYRLLLRASGAAPAPGRLFLVTVVRNAIVDLLPARTGELGYLGLLNRYCRVPVDAGAGSMAISFLLDLIALAVVLAVAAAAPWTWRQAAWPLLLGGLIALLAVTLLGAFAMFTVLPRLLPPLTAWCGRARLPRWLRAVADFLERVAREIVRSGSRPLLLRALALSLGVRFFKYGGLYAAFLAVTRVHLPALAAAPVHQVLATLLAGEGAAALPLPALLGFGAYEGGSAAVWKVMGFPPAAALQAMFALHVASQAIDYLLGAGAGILMAATWPVSADGRSTLRRCRWLLPLLLVGLSLLVAGALAWQWRSLRKRGARRAPERGVAVAPTPGEQQRLSAFVARHRGRIVWSSNRFGNHDILALEMPSGEVRRLTSHPHAESFPRLSPDGGRLLFARSQRPWVSQRDSRGWEVLLLDLASGEEALLATNACAPCWSADGRAVGYQQDGDRFLWRELASGRARTRFAAGEPPVPAGVQLQSPDYDDARGLLAVTLRGGERQQVVYGPAGLAVSIGGGCQLTWTADGGALLYIAGGGQRKNAVWRRPWPEGAAAVWLDLPLPFSHEYFPRLSRDGKVLLLGACAKGHEHDTADYEIFSWEVGQPAESAVRLTFHTGNDCWPDSWLTD